ncbi:unknown [Bacteroides sp. CAG:633]|nr:unknown [Bacteroides sp. CAG:633]
MYTCRSQYRIVVRAEGVEVFGIDFGCPVSAHQVVLEEDTYFGHDGAAVAVAGCGYLDAGQQVFLTVGTQHADGQLRAGQDDGLVQPFEHEAQGRGREGHRIGAVQDDEACILLVVVADDAYQPSPRFGIHVRRVHRRVELVSVDTEGKLLEFGHMLLELLQIEVLQRARFRILDHSDGSTGVY